MFEITHGSPGLFGAILIVCAIGAGIIAVVALLRSARAAHDEVIDDIHDHGGDLEG